MNMKERDRSSQFTIDQYTPPMCYELAGREYFLVMDDGYDMILRFTDGTHLEWGFDGRDCAAAEYLCAKADETTYLLSFEAAGLEPMHRENYAFVLDLDNMLVTRVFSRIGENPRYPYLITPKYEFGAIRRADGSTEFRRHGFTSDLIGTVVQWVYGTQMTTVHCYYCADYYRITYPRDPEHEAAEQRRQEDLNDMVHLLPSSDEPVRYIKIKEDMYLFSLTEANMEKLIGAAGKTEFRSNTMAFLQNYRRMYLVGRAFGTSTYPEGDKPTHLMYGAYGRYVDNIPQEFIDAPNPYMV